MLAGADRPVQLGVSSLSVVMAVHNGQTFLRDQIDSIVGQLLPGDELIVIDDASTDGSLDLLGMMTSPLLRVYRNPHNLGIRRTFERGLRLARHDLIFLSDQDDRWNEGKRTAFVAKFIEDPTTSVVISDAEVIDANGALIAPSFMAMKNGFVGTVTGTIWRNRYLGCAMAIHRRVLEVALPVPAYVPMHDMWLGVMGYLVGRVVYLPTPYLQYRRHGTNASPSSRQSLRRVIAWRIALLWAVVSRLPLVAVRRWHRRADNGATPLSGR